MTVAALLAANSWPAAEEALPCPRAVDTWCARTGNQGPEQAFRRLPL